MVQLIMPKMGESVAEATILKWLKKEGDPIEADEPILEIATDKVDSEVPSPCAGIMSKRLFEEGQVVKVGEIIAEIAESGEKVSAAPVAAPAVVPQVAKSETAAPSSNGSPKPAVQAEVTIDKNSASGRFYSPLVRNIAKQEGVPMNELENIKGSGANNRLTKQDLLQHLTSRGSQPATAAPAAQPSAPAKDKPAYSSPAVSVSGNVEIIEMDRMRKLIADHMVMSKQTSPHVTSYVEADVTNMVKWRDKVKKTFEKRENEKITFTPLFIEAVVKAIKDFPMVNISVDGTKLIVKKYINIGMAAALPTGNLIVPVIKNADHLNLIGLTKSVNDLANRARTNKLKPDEIQDGTFTITNVGSFGNVMGTPIINQPQVAILAVGAIRKKPAVIETPEGDSIGIRHMMFLSLSYDHRVVDGSLGGSFLRRIADYMEQFDIDRTI
ncbi:MAG TPA: dihydrolipoamide acetyltransferase family protein [Bacteroidia bacterium]|jgi:2-oxoglutarate dehydrogenase E2 component (dihydrolipoamide succinyltransferase)|nr:dihydrolipoamide acetyltransferase family protein [Bacteroidia bacterium]